jgi:hypothetical protein
LEQKFGTLSKSASLGGFAKQQHTHDCIASASNPQERRKKLQELLTMHERNVE